MRVHSYNLHLPHVHLDSGRDLTILYLIRVVRDISNKLIYLFFPIFLYQTGETLAVFSNYTSNKLTQGLMLVAAYYLLYSLTKMVFVIPGGQLVSKLGYHRTLTISYLLRIVLFVALFFSKQLPLLLFASILIDGFQSAIFWPAYYTLISKNTLKKNLGSDLSLLQFLLQLIAAVMPALIGFIAVTLGYEYLFLFGLAGPLVGVILCLLLSEDKESDEVSLSELRTWLREPQYRKLALANMGKAWNDLVLFLWPLYIFFLLGAVDKVGYVQSVAVFVSIVTTFFIGSYIDRVKSKKPFFLSGGVLSLLWVARALIVNVWHIAFSDVIDRLTSNFHWLFFDALVFRRGKGSQALSYFVYREGLFAFAGVLFWVLAGLTFILTEGWIPIFGFAVIGSLASLLISEKTQARVLGHD